MLPWSPLAGGLLSGKFTRDKADPNARRSKFDFPPVAMEKAYAIVDVLKQVAERRRATVAQIAIAWLLHQPSVTSVIIGAKTQAQLRDNLGALDVKLDAIDLKQLDEVSRLVPEYPAWMLDFQAAERRPGSVRDWSKLTKS
jgi:aryl-alcohol dehydrogenase-like predicted oxidoreductase